MVAQSKRNGIAVTEVIGDAAYSRKDNLDYANDENDGFALVSKLHPSVAEAHTKERDGFTFNKDADTYVCSAGHMAENCEKWIGKKENNTVLKSKNSPLNCKTSVRSYTKSKAAQNICGFFSGLHLHPQINQFYQI